MAVFCKTFLTREIQELLVTLRLQNGQQKLRLLYDGECDTHFKFGSQETLA